MSGESFIENLAPEILLLILKHLNFKDMCRLRMTCRRLRNFVDTWDYVLIKPGYEPFATNQRSSEFSKRCFRKISSKLEKLRIEYNWHKGRYKESALLRSEEHYMPWIILTNECLWLSRGRLLSCYRRNRSLIYTKSVLDFCPIKDEEIVRFKIKSGILVCGHSEGSVSLQSLSNQDRYTVPRESLAVLQDHTASVDISDDCRLVAAGMRSNCCKFWVSRLERNLSLEPLPDLEMDQRVWSVGFSDTGDKIAIGTSSYDSRCVYVYDTESFKECVEVRDQIPNSRGTLDLKWDGPSTVWSCGHEQVVRWDLRTGQVVQRYIDQFYASFYCIDCDFINTVAVGSNLHGKVTLYDTRQTNPFGVYFMDTSRRKNSPVYSVSFDSEMLFAATDQHLNILNFYSKDATVKNGILKDRNYNAFMR